MNSKSNALLWRRTLPGFVALLSTAWFSLSCRWIEGVFRRQAGRPRPEIGLEIVLPDTSGHRTPVNEGGVSMQLIRRQSLRIVDEEAARDFTAVDVRAQKESDAVKVRLSIIYNDLSNQEWWKEKKEKPVGVYLVREGESVRPAELLALGIEPFEMKGVSAKPTVFKSGEGPRVSNRTHALQVISIERVLDDYRLTLKNVSDKAVVAYDFIGRSAGGLSPKAPLMAAGAVLVEEHVLGRQVEETGITIRAVVFEDGTFDGDPKAAAEILAGGAGVMLQAPHVLRMIEQTLEAPDADLPEELGKLETRLWEMPEAIDKQSAIKLLREKFHSLDEPFLAGLYEDLKRGLYEARNHALSQIGYINRSIKGEGQRGAIGRDKDFQAKLIRSVLTRLKEDFDRIVSNRV
jgi:hypothetical protein